MTTSISVLRHRLRTARTFNNFDVQALNFLLGREFHTRSIGARSLSARTTIAGGSTLYFGLSVPAGRAVILFDRFLSVTQGNYHVDVVRAADSFTGGTEGASQLLDELADAPDNVSARLLYDVTPQGSITVLEYGLVAAGNTDAPAVGGAVFSESQHKIYVDTAMLRVTKTDTESGTLSLMLVVGEQSADD